MHPQTTCLCAREDSPAHLALSGLFRQSGLLPAAAVPELCSTATVPYIYISMFTFASARLCANGGKESISQRISDGGKDEVLKSRLVRLPSKKDMPKRQNLHKPVEAIACAAYTPHIPPTV